MAKQTDGPIHQSHRAPTRKARTTVSCLLRLLGLPRRLERPMLADKSVKQAGLGTIPERFLRQVTADQLRVVVANVSGTNKLTRGGGDEVESIRKTTELVQASGWLAHTRLTLLRPVTSDKDGFYTPSVDSVSGQHLIYSLHATRVPHNSMRWGPACNNPPRI